MIFKKGTPLVDRVRILYNIAVIKWLYIKWWRLGWGPPSDSEQGKAHVRWLWGGNV